MPQVTVYIRQKDLEAWQGVIKKSEFIHNALKNLSTYDGAPIVMREDLPEKIESVEKLASPAPQTKASIETIEPRDKYPHTPVGERACPHGYAKGLCKKTECNKKYRI